MARPRKVEAAKRTHRLIVRTTDEEQATIRANAHHAGLGVSEYVRRAAVDSRIVVHRQSGYGMSLARQLRFVGVNLNQLTRLAHQNGELPPDLAHVWSKLEKILDRIISME